MMREAVARTTWIASGPVSTGLIDRPKESTSPITPVTVGVDSEVVPPWVETENMLCVPQDV